MSGLYNLFYISGHVNAFSTLWPVASSPFSMRLEIAWLYQFLYESLGCNNIYEVACFHIILQNYQFMVYKFNLEINLLPLIC